MAGPEATSLVVDGLTGGTAYRFQVQAVNEVGPGPFSEPSNAVTPISIPTVVSSTPADGATNVAVNSSISVVFSEAITGFAGNNVTLTRVSNGQAVTFTRNFTAAANQLVINPFGNTATVLAAGAEYRVTLTGGPTAIRSVASGTPLATTTITFTTPSAPTVVSSTPANGATAVARGANVEINFSEAITGFNGSNVTITRVSNNQQVQFNRSFTTANNRLLLNPFGNSPTLLAANAQYRVTLFGGTNAIRTLAGTPLATTTILFTTGP